MSNKINIPEFEVSEFNRAFKEIIETLDLEDTILSTPALSEDAVFIRSDEKLWKLGR